MCNANLCRFSVVASPRSVHSADSTPTMHPPRTAASTLLKWIYVYFVMFLITTLHLEFSSGNPVLTNVEYPIQQSESGELRLRGTVNGEGIVEVMHESRWHLICATTWSQEEGDVACRQLGYEGVTRAVRVTPGSDELANRHVVLSDMQCNGTESKLMECRHSGFGNFTELCQPLKLPWVSCIGADVPEDSARSNVLPAADSVQPTTSLPFDTFPPPEVQQVGSDRVTISWLDWYDRVQESDPTVFRVRILVRYRRVEAPGIPSDANYTLATETPTYWTHVTITELEERATYEFIVQSVRLSLQGGEVTEPASRPVYVTTVCSGPEAVRRLGVYVPTSSSTSLRLSWLTPPVGGCASEEYVIEYQPNNTEQCAPEDTSRLVFAGVTTQTQFEITGLHPFSTYTVFVTARNRFGRSEQQSLVKRTAEAVPSGAPTNINHHYRNRTVLKLTWDPPSCGSRGGVMKEYTYMLIDLENDRISHSGRTNREYVALHGADSLRKYKFIVAASTVEGVGPYAVANIAVRPNIRDICGQTIISPAALPLRRGPQGRVSNGLNAGRGSAPWLAQLWSVNQGSMFCSGSILNEQWILTAAHCIQAQSFTPLNLKIQLGDYDTSLPETYQRAYDVAEIIIHDGFSTDHFDHDIALIRVVEPIEFNNFVRPICFPTTRLARSLLTVGRYGTVAGWGRQGTLGMYPRYLKQVLVPVVPRKTCRSSTNYSFSSNMFCAGYKQPNLGDACEGDSGAPFIVQHSSGRWYILGTVSWGEGCDARDRYGYYTRLHKYTSWIKTHSRVTAFSSTR